MSLVWHLPTSLPTSVGDVSIIGFKNSEITFIRFSESNTFHSSSFRNSFLEARASQEKERKIFFEKSPILWTKFSKSLRKFKVTMAGRPRPAVAICEIIAKLCTKMEENKTMASISSNVLQFYTFPS